MNPNFLRNAGPGRQGGSALVIAVLLLLLFTVAVFAIMPAMLGEQRVSGNELRSTIARHVADAGLSHGRELLRINGGSWLPTGKQAVGAGWSLCTAAETKFPCGAVPAATRANYYYRGNSLPASLTFPAPGKMYGGTAVGAFNATYDVGILLCRIRTNNTCTINPAETTGTSMFTIISRGSVDGENATATVTETIGTYRIIEAPNDLPPFVAAGAVQGVGNATIVGNPNGGGFGIPLTLWSYNDFDSNNGSWQSCQLDEYLRSATSGITMQGAAKNVPICAVNQCSCPSSAVISQKGQEGIDILDRLDSAATENPADPQNVTVPKETGGKYYFPPDLFHYALGFDARRDSIGVGDHDETVFNDGDYDETLIDANGNTIPDVEEFLEGNATQVIRTTGECSALNANSRGLIWVKVTCKLGTVIGSVDHPVALVIDGDIDLDNGAEVYGIVYGRATATNSEDCIPTGSKIVGCPFFLQGGGKARVFGSIVIEGGAKPNGNIDLIYIPSLIANLNTAEENNRYAGLPGSWTDRVSY